MDILKGLNERTEYSTMQLQLIIAAWVLSKPFETKKKISTTSGDVAEGDYDKAKEYSEQAKIYIERSNTYVNDKLLIYRANSLLKRAQERVSYFKSVGVQPDYQGYLDQAEKDLAQAESSYGAGRYEESIEYSKKVLAGIAVMKTLRDK